METRFDDLGASLFNAEYALGFLKHPLRWSSISISITRLDTEKEDKVNRTEFGRDGGGSPSNSVVFYKITTAVNPGDSRVKIQRCWHFTGFVHPFCHDSAPLRDEKVKPRLMLLLSYCDTSGIM